MKQKSEAINLTHSQAEEIISRYVGGGLTVRGVETTLGVTRYTASIGCLGILCENDWHTRNGRFQLIITDKIGGNEIRMYFYPDTLERDMETEEADKRAEAQKNRRCWVITQGRNHCHQVVNRLWNGELDVW